MLDLKGYGYSLLEGTLATSREPHGGFLVEATLPYEADPAGAKT